MKISSIYQCFYTFLVFLYLILQPPFVFFVILPPEFNKILIFCVIVLMLVSLLCGRFSTLEFHKNPIYACLLVQILYPFIYVIYHSDNPYSLSFFSSVLMRGISNFIVIFFIDQKIGFKNIINRLFSIMILMFLVNLIGYILASTGLISPFSFFLNPHRQNYNQVTYNYGFFFVLSGTTTTIANLNFFRTSGYFDEPGSYGLIVSFMLLILTLRYNLHNSLNPIFSDFSYSFSLFLLITSGLSTFSLAFYLFILLYFLFLHLDISRSFFLFFQSQRIIFSLNIKKLSDKGLMLLVLTILIVFVFFSGGVVENAVNSLIFARLEHDDEAGFKGNNRAESLKAIPVFLEYPLFGVGAGSSILEGKSVQSIAGMLSQHGLIGYLMYVMPFWFFLIYLLLFKKLKRINFFIAFLLLLNAAQRPYNFVEPFYLIIIGAIFHEMRIFEKSSIAKSKTGTSLQRFRYPSGTK